MLVPVGHSFGWSALQTRIQSIIDPLTLSPIWSPTRAPTHNCCRAHKLECDAYVAALKERVTRDVKLFKGKFNQYDVFK
jgi:hypothetical protein